jgi:hypothetical protein
MCTIEINHKILYHIEKIRRRVVWSKKTDDGEKCISLAAWDMVCKPKDKKRIGCTQYENAESGSFVYFFGQAL